MQEKEDKYDKAHYVVIGRIRDTYGIKGWLKVEPYLSVKHWSKLKGVYLKKKGGDYVPFELEGVKKHHKMVVIKFKGCDSLECADRFIGAKVFLPEEYLPKVSKDEYYFFQIEGKEVVTEDGKYLGKITGVLELSPYFLLEIDEGKLYVPFVSALVKSVEDKVYVENSLAELLEEENDT